MYKHCTKCLKSLPIDNFHKGKGPMGLKSDCKECVKKESQSKVRVLGDSYNHQVKSCHIRNYTPPSYTKDELIKWGLNNPIFHTLYDLWIKSGFQKSLKPSIDRINDYKSYSFDNIQIVTFSQNQQNYFNNTKSGLTTKKSIAVNQLDLEGNFIKRFPSIQMAGRELNIAPINIQRCCSGNPTSYTKDGKKLTRIQRSAGGFKWEYSEQLNDNNEQT